MPKDWPDVYTCKFLEGGIVSYEDSNSGIALLKKETIDKMKASFIGKPVIIDHKSVGPDDFDKAAVGYVIAVRFEPSDAWFYADFIVTDDEAKKCIEEMGYSVSCAFNVLDVAEGGLWHDIEFDGEILDGSFTHLALVQQPRYEESKITKQLPQMLVNGKPAHYKMEKTEGEMFKIFKKVANEKQEDFTNLHVEIDGAQIPVSEILTSYANSKKAEELAKQNEKRMAKDEDIVDVNGNKISIGELKEHYKKANEKKNEGDESKAKADLEKIAENEKEEEAKKKAEEEAKNAKEAEEKKKADEMENSKKAKGEEFFAEMHNASKTMIAEEGVASNLPLTRSERAAAWRAKNARK